MKPIIPKVIPKEKLKTIQIPTLLLMGVMIGTMIPQTGLYIIVILLMILFTTTWVTMNRQIHSQPIE
ncbi:hypothetical protein EXW32_12710 [Bacillus mycoides]|nr:hypothetical protein [Bacillus mycoides]QWG67271.1 hypothetical protein EXW32_12710 [Bacillus mycoides]QWI11179.1 hypothetical protein EXW47_12640 [Bacillus mycoides]QWI38064.1 hypothetical protein EXW43_13300 [Bacillus mycoides]QWI55638.1 hypothetical protein EXW42_16360 [Bacillus mycoides]